MTKNEASQAAREKIERSKRYLRRGPISLPLIALTGPMLRC
jgi:hypothetical protein